MEIYYLLDFVFHIVLERKDIIVFNLFIFYKFFCAQYR